MFISTPNMSGADNGVPKFTQTHSKFSGYIMITDYMYAPRLYLYNFINH